MAIIVISTQMGAGGPEVGMALLGPEALLCDMLTPGGASGDSATWLQRSYLQARAASIASGTSEILRGIIAMQVLGLPRSR